MSDTGWIILVIANIPVYYALGRVFWDDWSDLWEALRFWITPDIVSLLRDEFWDDCREEFKLGIWIACCVLCVVFEGFAIQKIFA